jgi:hypothetical protein
LWVVKYCCFLTLFMVVSCFWQFMLKSENHYLVCSMIKILLAPIFMINSCSLCYE